MFYFFHFIILAVALIMFGGSLILYLKLSLILRSLQLPLAFNCFFFFCLPFEGFRLHACFMLLGYSWIFYCFVFLICFFHLYNFSWPIFNLSNVFSSFWNCSWANRNYPFSLLLFFISSISIIFPHTSVLQPILNLQTSICYQIDTPVVF